MEPTARYTLVGSVVLAAIVGAIFFALWISRSVEREQTKFYTIYFRNVSLTGLQVDGNVTMRGIKIGRVQSVEIPEEDIELVRVIIEVSEGTPVKADTRAVVQQNLLTGLSFIDLVGGSQNAESLEKIDSQESYPVIHQGSTGLQQIQNTLPQIIEKIGATLDSIKTTVDETKNILDEENQKRIGNTLKGAEDFAMWLASRKSLFEDNLKNLLTLTDNLSKVVANVGSQGTETLKTLEKSSQELSAEIENISRDLGRASTSIENAAQTLKNPRSAIFSPQESDLGPGEHIEK